jgi:hypothetical protein
LIKNEPNEKKRLNLAGEISTIGKKVKAKSKKSIPTKKNVAAA